MKRHCATPNLKTVLASAEKVQATTFFIQQPVELAMKDGDGIAPSAPAKIQVFPKGPNLNTVDGRKFKLTNPEALAAKLNEAGREVMIDYDHKSHFMPDDGGSQVAAGWMSKFEVIDNSLWAAVRWTKTAAAKIADLEYRYFSPEFDVNAKTGEVQNIEAAALVNRPAFELVALAQSQKTKTNPENNEAPMLKEIAKSLGLPEDADEKTILAAIEKNKTDHETELASVKAKAKTPSVEDFMPRSDYNAVLARAEKAEKAVQDQDDATFKSEVETFITQAIADKKITPASKDHYTALCTDRNQLKKVAEAIGSTPPVVTGSGITGKHDDTSAVLTAEEKSVCASLGVSEEDFAKQKKLEAA